MMLMTVWLVLSLSLVEANIEADEQGYVMFCPCMGRFGNQADHYLGALAFAKGLNRTLVLPPFVEYRPGASRSRQVPFNTYFQVEAVEKYHRVITMEDFFKNKELVEQVWPEGRRISFCYSKRQPSPNEDPDAVRRGGVCYAKSGNPFGPFWDTFQVNFDGSETYGPHLHYDVHHSSVARDWGEKYPADKWPVLAFTGAPASYPVQKENVALQRHLFVWNDRMEGRAKEFIKSQTGAFVGIHLRNGVDWSRACDIIPSSPTLFAAAQCVGYRNEYGKATKEMCLPDQDEILRQVRRAIKSVKAKWVFVASDSDHMLETLHEKLKLPVIKLPEDNPHLDLAIMGWANHFVGNCVSSFSAFVKRERDVKGFPTTFFGFPSLRRRDEL